MSRSSSSARSVRRDTTTNGERPAATPAEDAGRAFTITTGDAVVRSLKTSESVARDIVHDIVSRRLRAGDRLPSEAKMLADYGVSRQSLREGLRLLEVQGLITLRRGPGGGPVVGHLDPANLGRMSTLFYHLAGATYAELLETWVLSESLLAERAARHPDRDAVREALEPFIAQDAHADEDGVEGFATEHARFHAVIASFAENRVLELMLQTSGQIVTHHVIVTADPRVTRDVIDDDHAEIARAIVSGHANKARTAMEEHIRRMAGFYELDGSARGDQLIDWR
jgi:GntR family transcriptional regulator, transcriptional repressor for pyruvate dehydrogenase complex